MKRTLFACALTFALLGTQVYAISDFIDDTAGYDPYMLPPDTQSQQENSEGFAYAAPSNSYIPYIIPNELYYELLGPMEADVGGSHLSVTNVKLTVPLSDPHRSGWGSWHLDAKIGVRMTWIESTGRNLVDLEHLYTVSGIVGVSRRLGTNRALSIGLSPQYSSDIDQSSGHSFYLGGYVAYSARMNPDFTYSVGIACMPDYSNTWVLPLFQFSWNATPDWRLKFESTRLSYDNVASERFHWGPFFQFISGTWAVKRDRQTQQFRWSSCALGMGAAVNLTPRQETKVYLKADVGFTFANEAKFRSKNGNHDLESYDYDPGFYLRVGLDLRF